LETGYLIEGEIFDETLFWRIIDIGSAGINRLRGCNRYHRSTCHYSGDYRSRYDCRSGHYLGSQHYRRLRQHNDRCGRGRNYGGWHYRRSGERNDCRRGDFGGYRSNLYRRNRFQHSRQHRF
jgi:hypothetical protein